MKMEVRVKYQITSKASISGITYNNPCDIITVAADGNDTSSFFYVSQNMDLIPRFQGQSKPPSTGFLSWSPNGLMISVANVKVELWKFDGNKLSPIRVIDQKFIQIKGLSWSHDSQFYLCYGITSKQNLLSINIRNIQTNDLKQIIINEPPILANFDPFGKYIAVLMVNNTLDLYDFRTLDKVKSISMAETKTDILTQRDKRFADWSPQYGYFAVPNLNDSKVPSTIILDRNKNFTCRQILLGHQGTISWIKFNPKVFQYNGDCTFILAIGDSSGCLSVWRIGKINVYSQPLFIASSSNKAEQSIEGIQWNSQGNLLIVNVLKKYLILFGFRLGDFGRRLSQQQKNSLIVGTYGASGASQITGKKLQVFGLTDCVIKTQIQPQMPKVSQNTKFQQPVQPKEPMIRTKQQTIINKDANNKEKKRIIPSKLVPESQVNQVQQQINRVSIQENNNGQVGQSINAKPLVIKFPILKQEPKKQYYLSNKQTLLVEYSKNMYTLCIRPRQRPAVVSQNQFKRFFNGEIRMLTITRNHILIINNEKLYILDFDLRLEELPCLLGEVTNFAANNSGTIFYMTTSGQIKGFNFLKHEFILQTSISYLLNNTAENSQITTNPLSVFAVFDDDSNKLHIQLKSNMSRYIFSKQTNSWNQFNFNDGFYLPGHSLKIKKTEKSLAQNFYMGLVTPVIIEQQNNKNQIASSIYEMQLLYYDKYAKDPAKFKEAVIRMIADLKAKGKNQQLRTQIKKYFIDKSSLQYLNDRQILERVKKIGGKVIQEFILLGSL